MLGPCFLPFPFPIQARGAGEPMAGAASSGSNLRELGGAGPCGSHYGKALQVEQRECDLRGARPDRPAGLRGGWGAPVLRAPCFLGSLDVFRIKTG